MKLTKHWHYGLLLFTILMISTLIGQLNIPNSIDFIVLATTGFAMIYVAIIWIVFAIQKRKK